MRREYKINLLKKNAGIYEIELDEKMQKQFEEINRAYGKVFDKRYERRMKKYRAAEKRLRDFVITF